jgi:spermidine synthase
VIIFEIKSQYHDIRVVENYPIRTLLFGNGMCAQQSAINLEKPDFHVFDFSLLAMNSLLFTKPSNILIIGLGGAFIPTQLAKRTKANIDIIEIDYEVVNIANQYFNFQESDRVKVHIGDAFVVIKDLKKKYDIIIVDAFFTDYVPPNIMSIEFYKSVADKLNENGVIASNICSIHPTFLSQINTIRTAIGDGLYYSRGSRNNVSCMLFSMKKDCDKKFLKNEVIKLKLEDAIIKSKVLSICS